MIAASALKEGKRGDTHRGTSALMQRLVTQPVKSLHFVQAFFSRGSGELTVGAGG